MSKKEEKAKEYAKQYDGYDWQLVAETAYEEGWDDALKSQWVSTKERPKLYDKILVLYRVENSYMVSQTKYFGFVTKWKFGGNDIIAWMPIPSFDNILEDNKDVLKRLKDE